MYSEVIEHDPYTATCACPSCSTVFDVDQASLDSKAGGTANNKPIWTADQAAAYLNRTGGGFANGAGTYSETNNGRQNNIGDGGNVITYGFFNTLDQVIANGYTYVAPNQQGVNTLYGLSEVFNFAAFNEAQRDAAREAFQYWDDVVAVSFVEASADDADMNLGNLANAPNTQAYARIPTAGLDATLGGQVREIGGDSWYSMSQASNFQLDEGGYGMNTLTHEIGHGLGLSHPGAYNFGPGFAVTYANGAEYAQDARNYSIMSYWNPRDIGSAGGELATRDFDWSLMQIAYGATPMVHDILAIQRIYGVDTTTRTGDNTYGFNASGAEIRDAHDFVKTPWPTMTIWDAGGVDTLDASGYNVNQTIDLTPGSLSSIGGLNYDERPSFEQVNANRAASGLPPIAQATYDANMAAWAAQPDFRGRLIDNVGIAYGTTIENAKGGAGNDKITGNAVDNTLVGNAGNDLIRGVEGNDFLDGGSGNDTLDGGTGLDTMALSGNRADYLIVAGEGDSFIIRDMRSGSADGTDTISGVEQIKFADGTKAIGQVAPSNVEGVADGKQGYVAGRTGNDDLVALGADRDGTQLRGGAGNDILTGGRGNDFLIGNQGDDLMIGGAGADQFRFMGNEIEGKSDSDRIFDFDFAEGDWLVFTGFGKSTFSNTAGGFIGGSDVIIRSFDQLARLDAASSKLTVSRESAGSDTLVMEVLQPNGQVQKILINDAWQAYLDATGIPG